MKRTQLRRANWNTSVALVIAVLITAFTQMDAKAQFQRIGPGTEEPTTYNQSGAWADGGVGHGFLPGAHEFGFDIEGGLGPPIFSQRHEHDLLLGSIHYGWAFAPRWELLGELWGGGQLNSGYGYVTGLTPHLRYFFMNHTRWLPFLDVGLGITDTSIRDGDLSTDFEFNIQVGVGLQYFYRQNTSFVFECRFTHISNDDIQLPNLGVNVEVLSAGISWYF